MWIIWLGSSHRKIPLYSQNSCVPVPLRAHHKRDFAELWNKNEPEMRQSIPKSLLPFSDFFHSQQEEKQNYLDLGCWRLQEIPCAVQSPTTPQREPKQPPGTAKYSTAGCSAREVWEHSKREVKHSRLPKSQTWTLEMQTPASLKSGPHPTRKVGNADRNHSGCSTLLSACRKAHESDF